MKKVFALVGVIALTLLMSAAWAQTPGDYERTDPGGVLPDLGVVLKSQRNCPPGTTFFKNAFPFLTNGQGGGFRTETFSIDNDDVTMTVTWDADNFFGFSIDNGVARKVGVNIDSINLLYNYVNSPVRADALLNKLINNAAAADVNHLDLCLAVAESEPPVVTIDAPQPGETVSGTVIVKATVRDNVEVSTVTASVGGVELDPVTSTVPDQYAWTWDTTTFSTGSQTVTVSATDTSGNIGTAFVDVTVVFSIASCEGLIGDEDQDPNQGEGCNPSGVENIQLSPDNDLDNCALNNGGEVCTIEAFLLTPDDTSTCGPNGFLDPRVFADGTPFDFRTLDVFLELGGAPDPAAYPKTAGDGTQLVLDEFTFGNPCFAVVYSERNFPLTAAFADWPNADDPATEDVEAGLVFVKTQFPELLDISPFVDCYDEVNNPDLQETGEATYQRTDKSQMIELTAAAMTNACFNPKRLSSVDKSYSVLNTKEHCGIDFTSSTGPDDVLDCKFERADAKFDALAVSLDLAAPFLISPKFADLNRKFNQARSQYDKKNSASLGRAISDLKDLLFQVATGDWTVTEENYPGDVQMRTENLIHRVTLLQRAFENL